VPPGTNDLPVEQNGQVRAAQTQVVVTAVEVNLGSVSTQNLSSDSANCGACGVQCSAAQTCSAGACQNPAEVCQAGAPCNTGAVVGLCASTPGVTVCTNGTASCSGGIQPGSVPETCNGIDDDCDGIVDNNIAAASCTAGVGQCARTGALTCNDGGSTCSVTPGSPTPETCNGLDDDCDGVIDNNCGATAVCVTAADCPGSDSSCQTRTCTGGVCGVSNAPAGGTVSPQVAGDCKTLVCDGTGNAVNVVFDADLPQDDNACTIDLCSNGTASHQPRAAGAACTDDNACTQADVCDGTGQCVGSVPVVCAVSGPCTNAGACNPVTGACSTSYKPAGTPCGPNNAVCNAAGACVGLEQAAATRPSILQELINARRGWR